MRFIFFLFLSTLLLAKSEDVCYTVQLFSVPISLKEKIKEDNKLSKDECQLMQISKTLTMRCGCYEHIKSANDKLLSYKEKYKHATVAMSYKYRFNKKSKKALQKKKEKKHKKTKIIRASSKENELRLLLQSFLFSQDLDNALRTIRFALKEEPHSLYWNQKMAEVLRWSGKGQEAIKYMEYIYYRTKKPELAKEILDYALDSYQYEQVKNLARVSFLNNPTQKNKERMLFIYHQIGEPQEAAQVLEKFYAKTKDPLLLKDILQIYMDMGDLENAQRIIKLVEDRSYYTARTVELISYYNYIIRNIPQAYAVLKHFDLSKQYHKHLNELVSDLGWYLEHYNRAATASLDLIEHKDGRLVDYERVIYAKKETNPLLALKMTQEGFAKYHLDYLFYNFANQALKENKLAFLEKTLKNIDNSNSPLKNQTNYWIIKARLNERKNNKSAAIEALQKADILAQNNATATLEIIDLYLQLSMNNEVKYHLNTLTKDKELSQSYLLIVSALYFTIHDINQASFYIEKLKEMHSPLEKNVEFQFLQDDIYKAQFNENAHFQTLRTIRRLLTQQLKKDPQLKKDDAFLYNSLRVSLHLDPIENFYTKLQAAKKHLSEDHYSDLAYSYATKIDAVDLAHEIYLKTKHKPYWLQFADALLQENHTKKADLLLYHLHQIPRDDASYGAHQIGDIALAQTLAFDSLQDNQKNKNAYISMLNYTKERTNLLTLKASYYNRKPLLQKYAKVEHKFYLEDGYYLLNSLYYTKNSPIGTSDLIYIPSSASRVSAGIQKLFNDAQVSFRLSYIHAMKDYYAANLFGRYKINNYFTTEARVEKNTKADESVELILGGKKESASVKLITNIFNSTSLEVQYKQNRYSSQDDIYIGKGSYINALLGYQIRNGYPDMRIMLSADYATFSETLGAKGVIELLRNQYYKVLPKNFYDIGITFDYGMQNSTIYTRVWRPFFEVSSYYNSETGGLSYGFSAGYGGKVFLQDHLVFGVNYSNNINGIEGKIFELYLQYQFLYPSGF